MQRYFVMLILGCLFTLAEAQEHTGYIGFGLSYATYTGIDPNYPLPSLQVGVPLEGSLDLRGTLESILLVSNLGLDLLYPMSLEASDVRLYAGGGGNLRFFAYYPSGFDLRAIFGGDYRPPSEEAPSSLFAEMRLYLRGVFAGCPTIEGRLGVNFPF